MFSWRITKYNPEYRDRQGQYQKNEWTSFQDIGKFYGQNQLTVEQYLVVEDLYIDAILVFMEELKVRSLIVRGLEKRENVAMATDLYSRLQNDISLVISEIRDLARMVLREELWCELIYKDVMFVHFGYDYYMYIGSKERCNRAISRIQQSGLFVEEFASPYISSDSAE